MSRRPLRRGNWSVQELERLRFLLPRRGVVATAALLRRSPDSVQRKGMQLLKVPPRRGAWTASDDARLRESWGVLELRLLAPMLGRPAAEVQQRVAELRRQLSTGPWLHDQIQALKDLYSTRQDEDLEVALGRSMDELAAMAKQLCLAKDKRLRSRLPLPRSGESGLGMDSRLPEQRSPARKMPRWSAAEVQRLRELYPTLENLEVARQLGRTVTSVANKAHQLDLKKAAVLLAQIGRANVSLRYRSPVGPAIPTVVVGEEALQLMPPAEA
jgi:hypothetical protein